MAYVFKTLSTKFQCLHFKSSCGFVTSSLTSHLPPLSPPLFTISSLLYPSTNTPKYFKSSIPEHCWLRYTSTLKQKHPIYSFKVDNDCLDTFQQQMFVHEVMLSFKLWTKKVGRKCLTKEADSLCLMESAEQ